MDLSVDSLLAWKGAFVLAWFAAFFAAERLAAAVPRAGAAEPRAGTRRLGRNLGLWLANVGLSLLVVVPLTVWAAASAPAWRPAAWQGWPAVALDVLALDFLIYWWHRANHEVPFLWRFHEVHHLDRTLDTTTAVRFHFGEVLLSALARAVVIVALDFPLVSVLIFEVFILAAAIFHHSNLRLPPGLERAVSLVAITPSIHWVHHHARRVDTDSNYGTIFSFWDPLFRTRSRTRRTPDLVIGVEGEDEQAFVRLFARPFVSAALRRAGSSGG